MLLFGEPWFKLGSPPSGRSRERRRCIISPCKVLELCHRWPGAKTIWPSVSLWPSCLWLRSSKRGLLWVKFSAGPQSARKARADGWLLTGKAVGRRRRSAALRPPGEKSWWSLKWISFMFHYRLLQPCESTLWVLGCKWGTGRRPCILQLLWLAVILKTSFLSKPYFAAFYGHNYCSRQHCPWAEGLLVRPWNLTVIILLCLKLARASI